MTGGCGQPFSVLVRSISVPAYCKTRLDMDIEGHGFVCMIRAVSEDQRSYYRNRRTAAGKIDRLGMPKPVLA